MPLKKTLQFRLDLLLNLALLHYGLDALHGCLARFLKTHGQLYIERCYFLLEAMLDRHDRVEG
jgi:hypothetical protein